MGNLLKRHEIKKNRELNVYWILHTSTDETDVSCMLHTNTGETDVSCILHNSTLVELKAQICPLLMLALMCHNYEI